MKKLFTKIIAIALALTVLFSFTACGEEVEGGSKIQRIKITLQLDDENVEVEAKLFVNYAPKTVEHVIGLIEKGYYNGMDISNIASSYFQFGDYKIANGKLEAVDQGSTVKGEFENAGLTGNRLTVSPGAILLKRDKDDINSGKATLAVVLSASAPFTVANYCVFGKIINDDGNKEADASSMEYLSSLERVQKVKECLADANGRKVFYCLKDEVDSDVEGSKDWTGSYITYAEYDGEMAYFEGVLTAEDLQDKEFAESKMITEDQLNDLSNKITVSENFMHVPTVTVKIVKIELIDKK